MSASQPSPRRRRFGPGDSMSGWSPSPSSSSRGDDPGADMDEWVDVISRALRDQGELERKRLGELVGCQYWGPGAFPRALNEAEDRGVSRKTGRGRYARG